MSTDQELLDLAMVKLREARAETVQAKAKTAGLIGLIRELRIATAQNDAAKAAFDVMRGDVETAYPNEDRVAVWTALNSSQTRLCAAQDAWMAAGLGWDPAAGDRTLEDAGPEATHG